MLYVSKIENGDCVLYDARTGGRQRVLCLHNAVSAVVNGDIVAVTCRDNKVIIFDCRTGGRLRSM